jgi:hypothetical protein
MVIIIASFVTIILGVGSLAWGFAEFGFGSLPRWLLYFGAIWSVAQARRWWWFSGIGLIFTILLAGLGLWIGIPAGWMFSAGIFSLFAWDLSEFRNRYRFVASIERHDLERRHLARVSLLVAAGLFLSSLVMLIRSQFTFEWAVFLLTVTILGSTQLIAWIQKK